MFSDEEPLYVRSSVRCPPSEPRFHRTCVLWLQDRDIPINLRSVALISSRNSAHWHANYDAHSDPSDLFHPDVTNIAPVKEILGQRFGDGTQILDVTINTIWLPNQAKKIWGISFRQSAQSESSELAIPGYSPYETLANPPSRQGFNPDHPTPPHASQQQRRNPTPQGSLEDRTSETLSPADWHAARQAMKSHRLKANNNPQILKRIAYSIKQIIGYVNKPTVRTCEMVSTVSPTDSTNPDETDGEHWTKYSPVAKAIYGSLANTSDTTSLQPVNVPTPPESGSPSRDPSPSPQSRAAIPPPAVYHRLIDPSQYQGKLSLNFLRSLHYLATLNANDSVTSSEFLRHRNFIHVAGFYPANHTELKTAVKEVAELLQFPEHLIPSISVPSPSPNDRIWIENQVTISCLSMWRPGFFESDSSSIEQNLTDN